MQQPPIYVPTGPPGHDYSSEAERPAAVLYFRVFCGFMAVMYVLVIGMGVFLMALPTFVPSSASSGPGQHESLVLGAVYAFVGAVAAIPYGLGTVIGRRPWVHTFGIVMIGLTMTSCLCIPLALPLLLAWLKPEVKAWYRDAPVQ